MEVVAVVTQADVVAKHNDLLPSLAKMTLQELRFLAFCVAHIDSRATAQEFGEITASVSDLVDIFQMTHKDAFAIVRRVAVSVNRHPAEWKEPDGTRKLRFWFQGFDYKAGVFTFMFSKGLEDKLLGLTGHFTRYRLRDVFQFSSASTWRLYEALRQWKEAGRIQWHLDEFRMKLGAVGKYPRFNDLVKRVIDPGIAEINKLSDIKVQWERVLGGRRVVSAVRFYIIDNPDTKTRAEKIRGTLQQTFDADALDLAPEIRTRLVQEFKFSHAEARHLANRCAKVQTQTNKLLDTALARHKDGKIQVLHGYVVAAIDGLLAGMAGGDL